MSYAFDTRVDPPLPLSEADQAVDFETPTTATHCFESAFFADRLSVTLGPIVMSHARAHPGRRRVRFKNHRDIFDLRKGDGTIRIRPGELLTVQSVESFELNGGCGAFLLPRLSLATVGIVAIPSYIDPHWNGILEFAVTNLSSQSFDLRFGEKLAHLWFYELGDEVPAEVAHAFAQKSHHYGMAWSRILESDAEPVPLRKAPSREEWLKRRAATIGAFAQAHIKDILGGVSVLALVVGVAAGWTRLDTGLHHLDRLDTRTAQLQQSARRSEARISRLEELSSRSGSVPLVFSAGQRHVERRIALNRAFPINAGIIIQPTEAPEPVTLTASISSSAHASTLVIDADRVGTSPLTVNVSYFVG